MYERMDDKETNERYLKLKSMHEKMWACVDLNEAK